jgi:hypothetical protein
MEKEFIHRVTNFIQGIEYVNRPDNPGKKYFLDDLFSNQSIEDLSFILMNLIDDHENDNSLLRLKDDFNSHLNSIIEWSNLDELPIAIEGLAQKYESFIKKIGYLRYKGTEYWSGNETSAGLTGTTLKLLCEGKVSNNYGEEYAEPLVLSKPLINYRGVSRSLIDFMRTTLRNAVHYAPTINRKLLIPYSEIVLVNYLLAIQDNIETLGPRYLKRLAHNEKIKRTHSLIQDLYIENKFIEHSIDNSIHFEPKLTESHYSSNDSNSRKREGTISEIFDSVDKFIIKGIGGLGKTTTLRFFSNYLVKTGKITPIYFPLKEYRSGSSLIEQILFGAKINIHEFESDLKSDNKYVFLLDGINEIINLNKRSDLIIDLNFLFKKYNSCSFIISSRKIPEIQQLALPIFNIQPFGQIGIIEFINKNFPQISQSLIPNLNNSKRLLRTCSNPLLLNILCSIYHNEDLSKTNNEALIIKTFVNKSLERERLKNPHVETAKTLQYLMDLGYYTRNKALVSFSQNDTLKILSNSSQRIGSGDDVIEVISLLKDLNFISESINGFSFNHELYQEYFAAEGLLFYEKNIKEIEEIDHWRNPILMFSGLTNNRQELINSIAESDPLLAAECVTTSIIEESEIENTIVEKSIHSLVNSNETKQYNKGVLALLRLKKYPELKKSLPNNKRELGGLVKPRIDLDGLSIIQTIIRELENDHLLEFIQLLLDKDNSYRNDIIRGLLDRDSEELKPIVGEIDLALRVNLSELNSTNQLNYLNLIGKVNLEFQTLNILKAQTLERIFYVNSVNSSALIIANELGLFTDIQYICSTLENIPSDKIGTGHSLPIILDNFYSNETEINMLLKSASRSKNLLVYISGCIYAGWNDLKSAQKQFKTYEVFSNKQLNKLIHQKNRNYNKLVSVLKLELLKKYGSYSSFKKLIGKSFNFEMQSSNKKNQISLSFLLRNESFIAKWRGKEAIEFIQAEKFSKGNSIFLKIKDADYKKGYFILCHSDSIQKPTERKKEFKIFNLKTKETDLGMKLKEALKSKSKQDEN